MKNPNRMVPSNQQQNNTDGSALVWVVSVLAILMIMVFSAVTVAMAFAVKASKHNLEQQLFYTARSGLDMIIKDQCDVDFENEGKTDVISSIPVGGVLQNIAVNFNSPEPLNPMGDCTAEIQRISDTKAKITVTAKYENLAQSSISAVVNFIPKSSLAPPCVITANTFGFDDSKQTISPGADSDLAVLVSASVGSNNKPVAGHGGGTNNIYCSADTFNTLQINDSNGKLERKEPFAVSSVEFPNRPAYYVDPQTGSLINQHDVVSTDSIPPYISGQHKIYVDHSCYSLNIALPANDVCYIRIADGVRVESLQIYGSNPTLILDCGDASYVYLQYYEPSITIFGGGTTASLKINTKQNAAFKGSLCFDNIEFSNSNNGHSTMTFTYAQTEEMLVVKDNTSGNPSSSGGEWKFVKYVTPETEVPA